MKTKTIAIVTFLALVVAAFWTSSALAAEPPRTADPLPDGTAAALKAMAAFRAPAGLEVELFAAEPQLGNPVAICLDERNRVFVAEEYRFNRGTEENRTRPFLLDDDLQLRTVDERLAMFQKHADKFDGGLAWFSKYTDQVRLLEDRDGDGRADRSSVFAAGFNSVLDGMAAGVMARDGDVYLTNIPHLWRLRDTDGDGRADTQEKLLSGFGVNAAFLGHDLHGLVWGPDGRLYFSVGDRGYHVRTKEGKTLSQPRRGAVFRCNADGTELAVIHVGLRNPQELAFDQFGNLFAADNNCDKGDHSRLVYVVEGGDSGWNMAYQSLAEPYLTGPWHAEQMWHLDRIDDSENPRPASVLPPVGKLGAGPSGFTYYPGTGLPDRYDEHFFMCNYTGNGGIEAFAVWPRGAGFEVVDYHDFLKPIMATDCDFGYDGRMYISDFVGLEWNGGSQGGRIYTLHDPSLRDDPIVKQVETLFRLGFRQRDNDELAALLRHPDMRVRLRAQFTLAERGQKSIEVFYRTLDKSDQRLARLHALWGLGMIRKLDDTTVRRIVRSLGDEDEIVAAQAAKVLGSVPHEGGDNVLQDIRGGLDLALLRDELGIRFQAALAIGKRKQESSVESLFTLLRQNASSDKYLRHAGVYALAEIGDRDAMLARADDPDTAVRLAVLLVLRRWRQTESSEVDLASGGPASGGRKSPESSTLDAAIARFLHDADLAIVTEAARAINDLHLDAVTPQLAALAGSLLLSSEPIPAALARRVIHANFRLGGPENAVAVLKIAAQPTLPPAARREALAALADWVTPSPRDRVTGFWRPLPPRDPAPLRTALEPLVPALLAATSGELQTAATNLVATLALKTDDETFIRWIGDEQRDATTRTAAFRLLMSNKETRLAHIIDTALAAKEPRLRADARQFVASIDPPRGLRLLDATLADVHSATLEKQQALSALAAMNSPDAEERLVSWMEKLVAGTVEPELHLDVLEAALGRSSPRMQPLLDKFSTAATAATANDSLAAFRGSLFGGDADHGRELFTNHRVAQCVRCHKISGTGGDAGPDLSKVAAKNDRAYLLQSLLDPSAKIATGFGAITLVLTDGRIVAGVVKSENERQVTLVTPDNRQLTLALADIEERTPPKSAMPSAKEILSPRELRDVVEFLATLK